MKKINLLTFLALGLTISLTAQQASNFDKLDINNISATINPNGKLFATNSNSHSNPGFEIQQSGKHTLNASSLWIGGFDAANNYHLMAPTYNQWGNDAFAGPLSTTQAYAGQERYNRVWKVSREEIETHIANYKNEGYVMPEAIANWPAQGDVALGQMANLAPFVDADKNGKYEPTKGDYPAIKGDQAVYFIYNDAQKPHTETGSYQMGIEIHGMAFAFDARKGNEAFSNTVFVEYEIFNLSPNDYRDVYIGLFNDLDMGEAFNDYMGVDVARNTFYAYNANPDDNDFKGIADDPHMSVKFLNEGLNGFVAYDNDWSTRGNPYSVQDYYYYLRGYWKDGQPLTYGGNGMDRGDNRRFTRYMFPGTTDPIVSGNWNEKAANNKPQDRRALGLLGPFNFEAGKSRKIALAYNFATTEKKMYKNLDKIQEAYDEHSGPFKPNNLLNQNVVEPVRTAPDKFSVTIMPNPMKESAIVRFDNPANEEVLIQLFDLTGKVQMQMAGIRGTQYTIDRKNLTAGMYIIEVRIGQRRTTAKLVVE